MLRDLTGKRFGKLTVIGRRANHGTHHAYECRCDCGWVKTVRADHLRSGTITSCGCYRKSLLIEGNKAGATLHTPGYTTS